MPLAPQDSPRLNTSEVSPQELNSEIEILKSRQVIEDALRNLATEEAPRSEGGVGRAIESLKRALGAPELSHFEETVVQDDGPHQYLSIELAD